MGLGRGERGGEGGRGEGESFDMEGVNWVSWEDVKGKGKRFVVRGLRMRYLQYVYKNNSKRRNIK